MTKLLILSDSHNSRLAIENILAAEADSIDALIFLGDGLRDLEQALTFYPSLRADLKNYLAAAQQKGGLGVVKLWMGGYSRGAAVANLLAARVNKELSGLERENVFVYTFATPVALGPQDYPDLQQDYDNNHNADGSLKESWGESNIFNIISSGDIVPHLLPEEWSFHRNGNDRFLPSTRNEEELEDLNEMGKNDFGPTPLDFSWLATDKETDEVMLSMEEYFISRENYHEKYEAALMDMIQCAFIRTEEEVTQNKVLDDGEVTDAHGRKVNFENTVIVMTSNAGSEGSVGGMGFGRSDGDKVKEKTMKALQGFLRPEFLNRVDEIITFNHLTEENFLGIADIMLKELQESLSTRGLTLSWDDDLRQLLVKKAYSVTYGARNLRRTIQKELEDPISEAIIDSFEHPISAIRIRVEGETVKLDIT